MYIRLSVSLCAAMILTTLLCWSSQAMGYWTDSCDVIWTTPSKDAAGSMPMGNGEVGINLWVQENGDLNFYISRTDSFSEISRLLKVGQVRVSLTPNPFAAGGSFKQQLHLQDGVCEITAGRGDQQVTLKVFVDADAPVVRVMGESASPVSVEASIISWRTEKHTIGKDEQGSAWTMRDAPFELSESADVFGAAPTDSVYWFHRNETSVVDSTLKVQSLESVAKLVNDPLLHRTFGGILVGDGFSRVSDRSIKQSAPAKSFNLAVPVVCGQFDSADEFVAALQKAADEAKAANKNALPRTTDWWHQFWDRSWVITNAEQTAGDVSPIMRGYTLQRYVQACQGRGNEPIKFNGGIFTVEPKAMGMPFNPDFRNWGDGFWWQNTRLAYHPMLASGDYEMMDPMFKMYESARPLCEARADLYHHCQGCYFPETMTIWGTYSNGDYGWNRQGHQPQDVLCPYWQFAWNQGPELVGLLLDRWDYTNDPAFLKQHVLPMAVSVLKYFDTRFAKDSDGRIVLDPTQSVETFWSGVINDMPSTAGLIDITARLCALPKDQTTAEQRAFFTHMRAACPKMPTEEKVYDRKSVRLLAPAEKYNDARSNVENPELYAVWPFRLYGIGKPDLDLAIAAYEHRANHLDVGWGYDGNCAALLGLTDEAARILKVKCANSHAGYRWPATWGPNFDWLPDQDHGGNLLETTQLMLLQCDGPKIRLLPAWPKNWDVSFKLHATGNTVVMCEYRGGKIEKLDVAPEQRRDDIVLPQ